MGRLPDAGLPLDQHRARLFDLVVEHAFDDADLVVPGDDRARHTDHHVM